MTYVQHRLDIYGTHIYATSTKRGWSNIRRRIGSLRDVDVEGGGQTSEVWFVPSSGAHHEQHIAVYVNPNDSDLDQLDTIAHEATHVAQMIFDAKNADMNSEPFAYLVGWLTAWLYRHVRDA